MWPAPVGDPCRRRFASVALMIMAAVAVNNGNAYRYPINIRLIK